MLLHRRKHGSQRAKAPVKLTIQPNVSGDADITFRDEEGTWYRLEPENEAEMKQLLSEAHIIHHNWRDS
jgi:hypothetical protein